MKKLSRRAAQVLHGMNQGYGEWIKLSTVPGIGRKTIVELLDVNAIEIADGRGVWSYEALYRVTYIGGPDLGDLWLD